MNWKRIFTTLLLVLGLASFALGDDAKIPNRFNFRAGVSHVREYATWKFQTAGSVSAASVSVAVVPAGGGTLNTTPNFNMSCIRPVGNGRSIQIFQTGMRVLVLDGSLGETVTLTAVSLNTANNQCTVTATFANAHNAGVLLLSGSFGLDEALLDIFTVNGGGVVAVDPDWQGTTAIITATVPLTLGVSNVTVLDTRRPGNPVKWALRPTAITLIAAPSAPTVSALTGGSLSSGAYKATAAYVDCNGGISLDSAESSATTTTTAVQINSPAASTGACGWLPRMSTAGGSANEILAASPLTSANCTLSTLVTAIAACAIGANATVSAANPSATAKPSVEANAFTTLGFVPFTSDPPPFVSSYPFGIFVVTATLNASNADGAQLGPIQGGYFNFFGNKWKVCVKGATATQVASSTLNINLTMANEYAQTIRTIATADFPTNTQAAAGTFSGCFLIQTALTGSAGKFWGSTENAWVDRINTANTAGVATVDVGAGLSSTLDLTKQIYVAVNIQGVSANNITGPIINSVTIDPVGSQ